MFHLLLSPKKDIPTGSISRLWSSSDSRSLNYRKPTLSGKTGFLKPPISAIIEKTYKLTETLIKK